MIFVILSSLDTEINKQNYINNILLDFSMVEKIKQYYDSDIIGELYGLPGGGLMGMMVGDHLHPPMVYDEKIWRDGSLWRVGAIESTRHLAEMAGINRDSLVLDVGSGLGGPARYLAKTYRCRVHGINLSELQIKTARRLTEEADLEDLVDFSFGDAESLPFTVDAFSVIWIMNMFYHVLNKFEALRGFYRILCPNGVLAFADWVITDRTTEEEHERLRQVWQNPSFGTIEQYTKFIEGVGFTITRVKDVSNVGRDLMSKYFEQVFDSYFRHRIVDLVPQYGSEIADTFKRDVLYTIQLYQDNKFGYYQLTAKK